MTSGITYDIRTDHHGHKRLVRHLDYANPEERTVVDVMFIPSDEYPAFLSEVIANLPSGILARINELIPPEPLVPEVPALACVPLSLARESVRSRWLSERRGERPLRIYRTARTAGYGALDAWRFARLSTALGIAESMDLVTFAWPDDDDYDPDDMTDIPGEAEKERKNLASGELTVNGCIATLAPWLRGAPCQASLWGIVTGDELTSLLYRRTVECDLAGELGILPDFPAPFVRP